MKLAFIGPFAFSPKGTMCARAHPLAAELVKVGHEVTMFLPPYDNPDDCGREWAQEGVRIRNLGTYIPDANRIPRLPKRKHPRLLIELIKDVDRFRPDVIHVFKPKGFAGAAGTYFLFKGAPVVLDCDDWEGWGGWNDRKSYLWMVKEYIDRQERWMIRHAHTVTVASRALERRAVELRANGAGLHYVPNCGPSAVGYEVQMAVQAISPLETRMQLGLPDGVLVLFSGHAEEAKMVSAMQRAVAKISDEVPVTLVVITDGIVPGRAENSRAGLACFSELSYRDFLRVVWACDIAAFPYSDDSVHRAKCSARIVDYMTMGKAVVTSAVGQNLEYIVDGESGILVTPGDEQQFAAELKRLACDPELRMRLGANAMVRIASNFRWSDQAKRCLAAYEEAINSSKASRSRARAEKHAASLHSKQASANEGNAG